MLADKLRAASSSAPVQIAWNISRCVYSGISVSIGSQSGTPEDIFFKPDGLKMYVVDNGGDDVDEYNLSTAWNVSTASYLQKFSVAAQETTPNGLFFKPDGLKMYVCGSSSDNINEYNLSTAWNVSTASYLQKFSVAAQETVPTGLFFKPDGLKMYIIGAAGDDINEYNLSTAWNVSTASYLQSFSVAAQTTNPRSIFFKPDGLKMYVSGDQSLTDYVHEYNLSTAWNVSTASYLQRFSVEAQAALCNGIFFKPDGLKMFALSRDPNSVFEYDLV